MARQKDLRHPIERARGLGSAHDGVGHWWAERATSVALLPLGLWFVAGCICNAGNYESARDWMRTPFSAVLMILFVIASAHHGALGLQVVIEDYIHKNSAKFGLLLAVKGLAIIFAAAAILSVLKITLGA